MRIEQAALLAGVLASIWTCGCSSSMSDASVITGGDPRKGAAAIYRYGCGSCHTISRIENARGLVGPPLDGIRNRYYVAGMLNNNPDNLMSWIRNPKAVNPKTAMPALGLSAQDATDIAAFLYSLD